MKLSLKNIKNFYSMEEIDVIVNFVKFLQKKISLHDGITINFLDDRVGDMSTGVRVNGGNIFVLAKNRLLIDVLRTISHEWIHEYQIQVLGVKDNVKHQDVGGKIENMANILSGIYIKKFQKKFPQYLDILYGE